MKNFTILLLTLIFVFSCRKPGVQPTTIHDRIIENKSSHSIKIKNLDFYEIELQKNEIFIKNTNGEGENPPQI